MRKSKWKWSREPSQVSQTAGLVFSKTAKKLCETSVPFSLALALKERPVTLEGLEPSRFTSGGTTFAAEIEHLCLRCR